MSLFVSAVSETFVFSILKVLFSVSTTVVFVIVSKAFVVISSIPFELHEEIIQTDRIITITGTILRI
jgi:hypothetical protein